jgi:hypothetical protein
MLKKWIESLSKPDLATSSEGDDDFYDTEDDYDDDDGIGEDRLRKYPPLAQQHITHVILQSDDYFRGCLYNGHQTNIALCYDRFLEYAPRNRYKEHATKFTAVPHLWGLEYLMLNRSATSGDTTEPGEFPRVHLGQVVGRSRLVPGTRDTYLVHRQLDHMYHYIIDVAYLGNKIDARVPPSMNKERQRHRLRRMQLYRQCTLTHKNDEAAKCPHEWLVYTKKTSEFYVACQQLVSRNELLTHTLINSTIPLSFNLVSFLCGPFGDDLGDSTRITVEDSKFQRVYDYDQWVIAPLYFIDLWNALRPAVVATVHAVVQDNNDECTTTSTTTNS